MSMGAVLPFWPDRPALEALDVAVAADRLGYDELWVGEMATFDAFALAASVAGRTARIGLTIGPVAVAVRDPVALALGVASVAALGARPAGLAVGVSTPVVVEGWHGRSWDRPLAGLRRAAMAVRPLLAGEKGPGGFRLRTDPPPHGQLTIAAFAPGSVRAAAELADRMVVNLVTPDQAARLREQLVTEADAAGRPPPPLAAWVVAAVEPGPGTLDQLRRALVPYLAAPGYGEMFAEAGFHALVEQARGGAHPRELMAAVPVELLEAVGAIGSAATVRDRLDGFRTAGVEHVAVIPATADDPAGERTLASARS